MDSPRVVFAGRAGHQKKTNWTQTSRQKTADATQDHQLVNKHTHSHNAAKNVRVGYVEGGLKVLTYTSGGPSVRLHK